VKIFHSAYVLSSGSEIGYITDGLDRIYIAIHSSSPDPELGLLIPAEKLTVLHAFRPEDDYALSDQFVATEWTKELDDRLVELIDVLVTLRISHPRLVQLPMIVKELKI
jgi:hypothetical protein